MFTSRKDADAFVAAIAAAYAAGSIPVTSHWTIARQARKLPFRGYWSSWLVPPSHTTTIEKLTEFHGGYIRKPETQA